MIPRYDTTVRYHHMIPHLAETGTSCDDHAAHDTTRGSIKIASYACIQAPLAGVAQGLALVVTKLMTKLVTNVVTKGSG